MAKYLRAFFSLDEYTPMAAWEDPRVFAINKIPAHATLFPFENRALALSRDPRRSARFLDLNSRDAWRFKWFQSVRGCMESGDGSGRADSSGWGTIPVPGNWELCGHGFPIYVNIGYAFAGGGKGDTLHPPAIAYVGQGRDPEYNPTGVYQRRVTLPLGFRAQNDEVPRKKDTVECASAKQSATPHIGPR